MLTVVSLLEEPLEVFNLLILVGEAPLGRRHLPRPLLDLLLQTANDLGLRLGALFPVESVEFVALSSFRHAASEIYQNSISTLTRPIQYNRYMYITITRYNLL